MSDVRPGSESLLIKKLALLVQLRPRLPPSPLLLNWLHLYKVSPRLGPPVETFQGFGMTAPVLV